MALIVAHCGNLANRVKVWSILTSLFTQLGCTVTQIFTIYIISLFWSLCEHSPISGKRTLWQTLIKIAEFDEDIVHKRRGFESYRRCDVVSLDKTRYPYCSVLVLPRKTCRLTNVYQGENDGLCIIRGSR